MTDNSLKALNGLKGVMAFVIAFFPHYYFFCPRDSFPMYNFFFLFYNYGGYLVESFFVISGVLTFIRYEQSIVNRAITFSTFLFRRIRKIYPLLITTVLFTYALQFMHVMETGDTFYQQKALFDIYHFILNMFGWSNGIIPYGNGPAWFITDLILVYIGFYGILSITRKIDIIPLFYFGLSICGCFMVIMKSSNFWMGRGFASFFLGCLLGRYIYIERERERIAIGGIFFLLLNLFLLYTGECITNNRMYGMLCVASVIIVWCAIVIKPINWILQKNIFQLLGKISMSLYLWNYPMALLIYSFNMYFSFGIDFRDCSSWLIVVVAELFLSSLYECYCRNKIEEAFWNAICKSEGVG